MRFTEEAGIVPHFARVLRAHGLDLETVRAGIDRLAAEGVLPGPQPSDAEDPVEVAAHRYPVDRRRRAMG